MSDTNISTLANAGATRFALAEYDRLGLGRAGASEDVLALKGRLFKDLYLSADGTQATRFAQQSAQSYEAAYQATQGYYSGINAATMSLLAGSDPGMIAMRARRIVDVLPEPGTLDPLSKYFVEATRSEALLLLGEEMSAAASLSAAREHDPLNYTAHASTLKQFALIADHRAQSYAWLDPLRPPISLHYSGHLFARPDAEATHPAPTGTPVLNESDQDRLRAQLVDTLQREDVGFGYGALAAGADILVAEALLEEGAELHLVLPVEAGAFKAGSVSPFGAEWDARFDQCLSRATSLRVLARTAPWFDAKLDAHGSVGGMGAAVRRAQSLHSRAAQLLIWDGRPSELGTGLNAALWRRSGRAQIVIAPPAHRSAPVGRPASGQPDPVFAVGVEGATPSLHGDMLEAAHLAVAAQQSGEAGHSVVLGTDLFDAGENLAQDMGAIAARTPGGGLYANRAFADWVSLYASDDFRAARLPADIVGAGEDAIFAVRRMGHRHISR